MDIFGFFGLALSPRNPRANGLHSLVFGLRGTIGEIAGRASYCQVTFEVIIPALIRSVAGRECLKALGGSLSNMSRFDVPA